MNERIKQLLVAAGEYEMDINDPEFVVPDTLKKFAELIVQECADIAKHHVMNISTYADADFVDEQIKQHFGVEE